MPVAYTVVFPDAILPRNSDLHIPDLITTDCRNPLWGHEWEHAAPIKIEHFHPASSPHRPVACARLLYDDRNLYLRFSVEDCYVVSTRVKYQEPVHRDSCVEFFVQPRAAGGYFNFEINCGGTLRLYFIEDPARVDGGFAKFTPVEAELGRRIRITHSAPAIIDPEIPGALEWQIGCQIPLDVLEAYVGPLGPLPGQTWHANFFKCADDSSHPHWASWSPIGEELNFHQPRYFAPLRFADRPVGSVNRQATSSVSH